MNGSSANVVDSFNAHLNIDPVAHYLM